MAIPREIANKVLTNLDRAADDLQKLAAAGKLEKALVATLVKNLDMFSDRFHVAAFGQKSFDAWQAKVAKVFEQDSDEPYMKTFENPIKPIQTDADEPYMHKVGPSFNDKGHDTFDADISHSVTDRDEFAVRDLNQYADGTKKQPSWERGPAGKSTKQGSTAPARKASAAPAKPVKKTWAP